MSMEEQNSNYSSLPHILVVDDDDRIRTLITRFLQENQFIAMGAQDAFIAESMSAAFEFDAIILDVMMPKKSGFEFLKEFRQKSHIPVIMLTALGEAENRIQGLEWGADDYLSKPFEPRELILRLKSVLKRTFKQKEVIRLYRIGQFIFDYESGELKNGSEYIHLTTVEINLLRVFLDCAGEVMTREELALACGLDAGERTIDVQVTRLRRKIEESTKEPRYLLTLRGKGYLLRAEKIE